MARLPRKWILPVLVLAIILAAACSPGGKRAPEKTAPVKFPLEEKPSPSSRK